MRHSGAIVEGGTSAVAPGFGERSRGRSFRRGIHRTGASARFATRWRPQPRVPQALDRAVPLSLAFAAVAVWVTWGFRIGYPSSVAAASVFAAVASVVQVAALVGAAYLTAAVTAGGFGDVRSAVLKFSMIVLASMGAGAVFGDWGGAVVNVLTFAALVAWLFDVELLDAVILWGFYIVLTIGLSLVTAALFLA